jgi:hypothetical protein
MGGQTSEYGPRPRIATAGPTEYGQSYGGRLDRIADLLEDIRDHLPTSAAPGSPGPVAAAGGPAPDVSHPARAAWPFCACSHDHTVVHERWCPGPSVWLAASSK